MEDAGKPKTVAPVAGGTRVGGEKPEAPKLVLSHERSDPDEEMKEASGFDQYVSVGRSLL